MGLIDSAKIAAKLARSRSWFYAHRKELEAWGFPKPLPVVERWDSEAVDAWIRAGGRVARAIEAHKAKSIIDEAFS